MNDYSCGIIHVSIIVEMQIPHESGTFPLDYGGRAAYMETSPQGCFTLWPKVKRPLIFTNQIARNQEFGLSTLHTRSQSPKVVALQNAYMAILFDEGDGLSKKGWSNRNGNSTYDREAVDIFSFKKIKI
jgi:hypothetical protein